MSSRVVPGQFRRLTTEDFRLLRDVFYEHAGLVYDESAMLLFDRRLGERLEALGLPSYQAYYKYLRFDARNLQEIEEAIELLRAKLANESETLVKDAVHRALIEIEGGSAVRRTAPPPRPGSWPPR